MDDLMGEDGTFDEMVEWEIVEHCEHCELEFELAESDIEQGDVVANAANEQVCDNNIVTVADSDSEEAETEHAPHG